MRDFDQTREALEQALAHGCAHRGWELALRIIEARGEHPSLRRAVRYHFLSQGFVDQLPASFWDEPRARKAKQFGLQPRKSTPRLGAVAFPVVFPSSERDCFLTATVRPVETSSGKAATRDELPSKEAADEDARTAMANALEAARRLSGDSRRFHVVIEKPFLEPVRGASCGLAVALAALSCIEEHPVEDSVVATGDVPRELAVLPVQHLADKSRLRREARPLARLLCPTGAPPETGLIPVSRLDEAKAKVWASTPREQADALRQYKHARAEDPQLRRLQLNGLAGIPKGPIQTELDLLDVAVAPSLHPEDDASAARVAQLLRQRRPHDIDAAELRKIDQELERLQAERWHHYKQRQDRAEPPMSFAHALHRCRRLAVIGDAGAGKSILTQLAVLACDEGDAGDRARKLLIQDDWFNPDAGECVATLREMLPVHLRLGQSAQGLIQDKLSIEDLIRRQLREKKAAPALIESLGSLMKAGRLFLLCDGFDEVPAALREPVVEELLAFLGRQEFVRLLVTSRPHGYTPRIQDLAHTRLAPLHDRQQQLLVERLHLFVETRLHGEVEGAVRARNRTDALLHAITTRYEWNQLSSNPLLLTLSALTRAGENGLPEHRVCVFENFVHTLVGKWRSSLSQSPLDAERLMDVWSTVALDLVRQDHQPGINKVALLRMLEDALGGELASSSHLATVALNLALETGLVREEDKYIQFWHRTFGEFLAARALTANRGRQAAARILQAHTPPLPPLVLQLAAARLDYELAASHEVKALAKGLLALDEQGAGRLLRPGLRAVSAFLADGVRLDIQLTEHIWSTWADLLVRTPPSPLWSDFCRLAERTPHPRRLSPALVERLARLDDPHFIELQEGLARIVAPYAGKGPAVLEACQRWLGFDSKSCKLHGAFALASTGDWSTQVIDELGRFGESRALDLMDIHKLVRNSGPQVHERLRELVRQRLPSDEPPPAREKSPSKDLSAEKEEAALRDLRLSAACLLAIAELWDDDVARVLMLTLSARPNPHRPGEAKRVLEICADDSRVQAALLDWMVEDASLGDSAREVVRNVAPLLEKLPEAVLERAVATEGPIRQKLDHLLEQLGQERRTLTGILRRWIEDPEEERRLYAAGLLRSLAPRDERLHEAVRKGLRSPALLARARWARLAFSLGAPFDEPALEAMLSCAKSAEPAVCEYVFNVMRERVPPWSRPLTPEELARWIECASATEVPARARLNVTNILGYYHPEGSSHLCPLLRKLVEVEDAEVRRKAALQLVRRKQIDERVAVVVVEEAARMNEEDRFFSTGSLKDAKPFAGVIVRTALRELAHREAQTDSRDLFGPGYHWERILEELAPAEPSTVNDFLDALAQPGLARSVAHGVLSELVENHAFAREALLKRLGTETPTESPLKLLSLIVLGLRHEDTSPAALEALQRLDRPGAPEISQKTRVWLATTLVADSPTLAAAQWRLVLDGPAPELALKAAEELAARFPEEAGPWLHPVLPRMLEAAHPPHRLYAARVALYCGLHEEAARRALVGCIELGFQPDERSPDFHDPWMLGSRFSLAKGPFNTEALARLDHFERRIDFEAMYSLCSYSPLHGLPQLARWLHDEDGLRFRHAVDILASHDEYRDTVGAALAERLSSGPANQLHETAVLVLEHDFDPLKMVERVFERWVPGQPFYRTACDCFIPWLSSHPELWAVFRKQTPERREVLRYLLPEHQPSSPETVAFAVEVILAPEWRDQDFLRERWLIEKWCSPPEKRASGLFGSGSEEPQVPEETVRHWLREALDAQPVPEGPLGLVYFDHLAELGELPRDRRIERLRGALALDASKAASDEREHLNFIYWQQIAGRRLLRLQGHDARLLPILEEAVRALADSSPFECFPLADRLLSVQATSVELQEALRRAAIAPHGLINLDQVLEVLEKAGFSASERADLLVTHLCLDGTAKPTESLVPAIFQALEKLGCEPARRAALLTAFVNKHGNRLTKDTSLQLADRSDIPDTAAASLLLSAILPAAWNADTVAEHWLKRFAPGREKPRKEEFFFHSFSRHISSHLRGLATLIRADDPWRMRQVLAELAGVSNAGFLSAYRQALSDGPSPQTPWRELIEQLAIHPGEEDAVRLSKELLMLGLWEAHEQATISELLHS